MSKTSDQPAFPVLKSKMHEEEGVVSFQTEPGMTLRQYFSGLAMQGLLARQYSVDTICSKAVEIADNIISELDKTKDNG